MSDLQQLTEDDLNTLIDALEAWENKDFGNQIMGDMLGMMLTDRKDPIAKAKFEQERDVERAKQERARTSRKERSLLLRAKLLTIRNDRNIGRIESTLTERQ